MTARRGISGHLVKECVTAFKHINHKAYGRLETRDGLVNALRHRLLDVVLIEDWQVVVGERVMLLSMTLAIMLRHDACLPAFSK